MALKITTQISTDRGLTSEAYVRIISYTVSKTGNVTFSLQTFLSEEDITPGHLMYVDTARNYQIGDSLVINLIDPVTMIPDFTELESVSIFAYGYAKLKEKLQGAFGSENVIDC